MKLAAAIVFLLGVGGLLLGGAWEVRDYELAHKPMAQAMWADFEFRKCLDDCRADQMELCRKLRIPEEECPIDCKRCDRYKEKR